MSKLKMLDFSNDSGLVFRAAVRYEKVERIPS